MIADNRRLTTDDAVFRCGYIALLGRPNVGKSTLINALVGEGVSIVTPKPQTTRRRIVGLLNTPSAQMVIVDTPGFHDSPKPFNQQMMHQLQTAILDADICCLLLEPRLPLHPLDRELWGRVREKVGALHVAVVNKMDTVPPDRVLRLLQGLQEVLGVEPITCSAKYGTGVRPLLERCMAGLPVGPALYPTDIYTEHPTRFLVAELIREQATLLLDQELPYALGVEMVAFQEQPQLIRIEAAIVVEKESQKGIVIGNGGRMIKQIGQQARVKIESLVGAKVYLELRVRVEAAWTKDPAAVERFS